MARPAQGDTSSAERGTRRAGSSRGSTQRSCRRWGERMAPVTLGSMTPAQEESWRIPLDLYADFPDGRCLISGRLAGLAPLRLEGTSTDGIGHRYLSTAYQGPGKVAFDVLAPDNVGERADLTTSPPARTVSAPGSRAALDAARPVQVAFGDRAGHVLCPSLLTAILAKAAATTIPVRENRDRDWVDAAFLLSSSPTPWPRQPRSAAGKGADCVD
jgi:hypothetical protein